MQWLISIFAALFALACEAAFVSACRWGILEFLSRQATLSAEQQRHVFLSYEWSAKLF